MFEIKREGIDFRSLKYYVYYMRRSMVGRDKVIILLVKWLVWLMVCINYKWGFIIIEGFFKSKCLMICFWLVI